MKLKLNFLIKVMIFFLNCICILQNGDKEIEEYFRDIKRVVKKKMFLFYLVLEMFCVDCNDKDEDVFDKI